VMKWKQLAGEDVGTWWCGVENSTHHQPSYYISYEVRNTNGINRIFSVFGVILIWSVIR
jgi:hypothetical protein